MIRAVFFDIDGTLVSFNSHTIPDSTIQAIRRIRQKGVKVFIATGRPLPFVDNLGSLEYDGIMTVNGANCQTSDGTIIRHNPVECTDLVRLIDFYHTHPFPIAFASNDDTFVTGSSAEAIEIMHLLNLQLPRVAPVEACLDMDVMQIIAFYKENELPRLMTEVLTGCDTQRWHPFFTDIIRKGNNKAHGIDAIIGHYGITLAETMAFGDGGNDISMLQHVGLGVAMGNARAEVKAAAKYVTNDVDHDGISLALSKFVP